ncbi:MAG: T9SS type A sorting domain-containing protein, partial [Bacteroidetes bacterium]|nr:T9SS type A sorting domain-containing protein [Bacteroidota bacterium]
MNVSFSDSSENATSYFWDFNGNGINESTTAGNVNFTYSVPGQYIVRLIVSNTCDSDTIYKTIVVTGNGVEDNEILMGINIFPNPSNGQITVYFESQSVSEWKIDIKEMQGRTIVSENVSLTKGKFYKMFDLSVLSKGAYIISVYNNFELKNKLLIIE